VIEVVLVTVTESHVLLLTAHAALCVAWGALKNWN